MKLLPPVAICFHAGFLYGIYFNPEDGDNMLLQNFRLLSIDYRELHSRRYKSSVHLVTVETSDLCKYFTSTQPLWWMAYEDIDQIG
jgi:hypothetical protein